MKRLITEEKVSEIHIDDITTKDIIVAMDSGKIYSTIIHLDGRWCHVCPGDTVVFEHEKLTVCLNDVVHKNEGFHVL